MPLPDGVTPLGTSEIANARRRVAPRAAANRKAKAEQLIGLSAQRAHQIFISTFIQHSTYVHFAVGDLLAGRVGAFSKTDDWIRVRKKALPIYFGPGVNDFTFEYYAATQLLLSRAGPAIRVYRGVPRDTAKLMFEDLAKPGLDSHVYLDALSSWSDQPGLAERFAIRAGGAVVSVELPVECVFAHWRHDSLLEAILRRQCEQHLKSDPDELGGEVIVWCPLRCIKIGQLDVVVDRTQVEPKKKF